MPGLPEGCLIEYTTEPSELEPFRTEPCTDRPGCEWLIPEWEWGPVQLRVDGGVMGSDPPAFFFSRNGPLGHWEKWLVRDDGRARVGVRGHFRECYPADLHASSATFGFVTLESAREYDHSWVFGGDWASSITIQNLGRLSDLVPGTSAFHRIRAGSRRISVQSAPLHTIVDVPRSGEAALVADTADGGQTYLSAVIGDTIFYDVYGGRHHIRAATSGERGQVLIDPPDAEAIRVLTDGTDLAWIQAYGRIEHFQFERLELWASPYAERPEDLVPRRVAELSFTNPYPPAEIGSGYVAIREWDPARELSVIGLYRLADGARAEIPALIATTFLRAAAYITPDVFAVGLGIGGSPPRDWALMKIQLNSLEFVLP